LTEEEEYVPFSFFSLSPRRSGAAGKHHISFHEAYTLFVLFNADHLGDSERSERIELCTFPKRPRLSYRVEERNPLVEAINFFPPPSSSSIFSYFLSSDLERIFVCQWKVFCFCFSSSGYYLAQHFGLSSSEVVLLSTPGRQSALFEVLCCCSADAY
jgi:hypothetical protein